MEELGRRLADFGQTEASRRVIAAACRENEWFTPAEVERAVGAICSRMLTRERLTVWLAAYEVPVAEPRNVLVVMAGNIPLVGFFDLLCVVAAGHCCLVKPSAKDRVLISAMVDLLRAIDPAVRIAFYDGSQRLDAVIATGSDNANRLFRSRYAGLPSLLRGSRQSVAVLSGRETEEQLAGLADDIWAYSGLGCRNVSMLFVPRGCALQLKMPAVSRKYRNNYRQQRALLEMGSVPFVDLGASLLVEEPEFPTALSRISCRRYDTTEEVEAWLAAHDGRLQCVVSECVAHNRRVAFGAAQCPELTDYPDACDVMKFLTSF